MPRSRLYANCGSARADRAQPRQRSASMSIPKTGRASEGVTTGAAIGGKRGVVVTQASARRFSVRRFFGDRVRQDPAKGRLRCGEAFALLEPCVICADGLLAHDAIPCWRFASPLRIRCGVLNRAPAHCRVDFLCPPSSPTPDGSRVSFVCLRLASCFARFVLRFASRSALRFARKKRLRSRFDFARIECAALLLPGAWRVSLPLTARARLGSMGPFTATEFGRTIPVCREDLW